ncbi:pyocin activator PrtN family protein [Acinetobacter soli]|uniref:pyocin activator PrtN family protein n=1 Tax=Acinetobacter soli TaxID=487316 RepID=UPI00124FA509|nr:pyocin activator PrtN family protein [Acinetobacter soli]MCF3128474.1 pyocin activator PrtN family protein [Acinetobacter soli]
MKNNFEPRLSTYTILMLRYMSPVVPLENVVQDYMSISIEIAKRKAIKQELPFPVIRLGEKQKAAWMVNLADLAVYIDQQTALAQQDHKAMNGEQYAR